MYRVSRKRRNAVVNSRWIFHSAHVPCWNDLQVEVVISTASTEYTAVCIILIPLAKFCFRRRRSPTLHVSLCTMNPSSLGDGFKCAFDKFRLFDRQFFSILNWQSYETTDINQINREGNFIHEQSRKIDEPRCSGKEGSCDMNSQWSYHCVRQPWFKWTINCFLRTARFADASMLRPPMASEIHLKLFGDSCQQAAWQVLVWISA